MAASDRSRVAVETGGGGMQIFASTMDGKTFAFEVSRNCRISDVRKIIHEKIGLAPDEQKLVYYGGILKDDKTVDEYQIAEKSVIHVLAKLRNGMQIFAKTMDGKTIAFEVSKNGKIIDVKMKIQEKMGLAPCKQKLVYGGVKLEDDATVEECQIEEKSVINVVARLGGGMQIFAMTTDGKTMALEVSRNDRIIDVKERIREKIGLAPCKQKLVYGGQILEDDATAEECQIWEKSIINVVARMGEVISICVQSSTGGRMTMEVRDTERVVDVKRRICMKLGITGGSHVMRTGGRVMRDDHQMLIDYGIRGDSVIEVRPISRMMVSVENKEGEVEGVEVLSCDSIKEVMEKVEVNIGLPVDQQVLCLLEGGHRKRTRGLCAVIGCDTVPCSPQGACGTAVDEGAIRATLAPLGYDIKVFRNAALADIGCVIDAVKTDLRERHAVLVVFVLGHMRLGAVSAADGGEVSTEAFWAPFTRTNLPRFAGKPKLFFFVGCPGPRGDIGTQAPLGCEVEDGGRVSAVEPLPAIEDLLIVLAGRAHYERCRLPTEGSAYVARLCEVIREHPHWSLERVHEEVERLVTMGDPRFQYQAHTPHEPSVVALRASFIDRGLH